MRAIVSAPAVGVRADKLHLEIVQPARLGEDLRWHNDFADVMEKGGYAERLDRRFVQAEPEADRGCQLGHAALVASSVGVTQLGGRTEGVDCALEGEPELQSAGGQFFLGSAYVSHVKVDSDEPGWFARDVREDSLVSRYVTRLAVPEQVLDGVLNRLLRVIQKLTVYGIEASRQFSRVDIEDCLTDDLVLAEAEKCREGLVTAQVAEIEVLIVNGHRDRLQELLEEVGTLLDRPARPVRRSEVSAYEGDVCVPVSKLDGSDCQVHRELRTVDAHAYGVIFGRYGKTTRAAPRAFLLSSRKCGANNT